MRHLTVQQISGSLDGALAGVSLELVVRHLSGCRDCRERHASLTKQDDALRRLIACDFPEVHYDDMFARLGVVLEAEAKGQIPPDHALPPELPPLPPDPPPAPEPRRPIAIVNSPALPSPAEQKRRAEIELKAAESAALASLEELMKEMQALKQAPPPASEPAPAPAAPPAPRVTPPALDPTVPPKLVLPPDVLQSIFSTPMDRPERSPEPEPLAVEPIGADIEADIEADLTPDFASEAPSEPVSEPEPEPADEPVAPPAREDEPAVVFEPEPEHDVQAHDEPEHDEPVPGEPATFIEVEETSLTWVVVDGPLSSGPGIEGMPEETILESGEPDPAHSAAHEPAHEPEWPREPEPVHHAAEPSREPEPVASHRDWAPPAPRPEPARAPGLRRPYVPPPLPEFDPNLDDLDDPPPPRRGPAKRHVALALAGVAALLVALGAIGYLPPVIRVPVPVLPKPHLPRFEVVQVPIAPAKGADTRPQESPPHVARVIPARPAPSSGTAHPAPAPPPAPAAQRPTTPVSEHATGASEPGARAGTTPARPRPAAAVPPPSASAAEPVRAATTTPPAAEPVRPSAPPAAAPKQASPPEPAVDDNASWPLLCGVVLDETGAPVAGARVSLADLDLGARTDRRGHFCIAAPPGDRTLSVVAAGFATHRRIVSLEAQNLDLSITLTPAP